MFQSISFLFLIFYNPIAELITLSIPAIKIRNEITLLGPRLILFSLPPAAF